VVNAGSCGRRVPRQAVELPANADLVLVMLGTNDLLNGDEPETVAQLMREFLKTIGPVHVALVAPPMLCRGEWVGSEELVRRSWKLADAYRRIAVLPGVRFIEPQDWSIPLCYDGVHFTESGHREFAEKLARELQKLDCISVQNMRDSDAYTIANFVPGLELMHRAAMGVFLAHDWQGSAAIVCGSGNNGGDGFALACILWERGYQCAVFTVSSRLSADSAHYAEKARSLGIPIEPFSPGCLAGFDTVVDCLLGTGFAGGLRENYRAAIEAINESGAFVLSLDINSGMNGDTGEGACIVRSDLTVTIGFLKHGLVTEHAGNYMKRLVRTDIGILLAEPERLLAPEEFPRWLDPKTIVSK
jgi:NAD(P)H-hydrate epimerase